MKNEYEILERISALMDGESSSPDEDSALVRGNDELARRHRQYQQIRQMMSALPEPEPSPHFVEQTLAKLPQKARSFERRTYQILAVAAILLLSFTVALVLSLPQTPPETLEISQPVATYQEPSLTAFDVPDDELFFLVPETSSSNELEQTLALFEAISEEAVIVALAEMSVGDPLWMYETESDVQQESSRLDDWDLHAPGCLADIFMLMETLDTAEVAVLNNFLRDALAKA